MTDNYLNSWNETEIKKSITDFVTKVTAENSPGFIPVNERIAVFDNDGTLWTEQPLQVEIFYALYRMKILSGKDPSLKNTQPFKAFIEEDIKTLSTFGKKELLEIAFKSHDGKTPQEFYRNVKEFFENSVHPKFKFSYYNCAYKPQLELLDYLRANGFKIFIVSGGGLEFMRVVTEKIYEIPNERVIGSTTATEVVYDGTKPVINRLPQLSNFDDKEEKVLNIHHHIGGVPVLAFGNSDGDLSMLRYTLNSSEYNLALLLHHDDASREVAYDKDFVLSPLNEALKVSAAEGIRVVSMKNDWNEVF
ncbi:MAG: haloacid dehalogenase-like hydrolase [Ignavibacteria bacterium]|nr:haloacid dehalogenase-like hydrolase [Ignavibacteria bacterium]